MIVLSTWSDCIKTKNAKKLRKMAHFDVKMGKIAVFFAIFVLIEINLLMTQLID